MRAPSLLLAGSIAFFAVCPISTSAQLRITLPKRSNPTPVQKLNQDGVKAVRNRDYDKAKKLFYRAYLMDPNDPFTLNNLGYMAELDGEVERAQRFYALAAELNSEATIAQASSDSLQGKAVAEVAGKNESKKVLANQYNLEASGYLAKDRAPEADLVLQKALKLDPSNPFTLNNMGFAKEKEGELEQALSYYNKAALSLSQEPVVVALDKNWRGKPISEIAADNADKLRKLLRNAESREARVQRLSLQGVSALNRNEPQLARNYFEQAYKLDPNQAFTLNNMGYLAELSGDRETADFYYARAREARSNGEKVDVATRVDAEGKLIREVAEESGQQVAGRIQAAREAKIRQGGSVVLRNRDGSVVIEPERPPTRLQRRPEPTEPQLIMPLPDNQQPGLQPMMPVDPGPMQPNAPSGGLLMPLPENQQPSDVHPTPQDGQSPSPQPPGGLLMPLPDDQQPPAVQPTPQDGQPASPQPPGGLLMPLPDDQQPPASQR